MLKQIKISSKFNIHSFQYNIRSITKWNDKILEIWLFWCLLSISSHEQNRHSKRNDKICFWIWIEWRLIHHLIFSNFDIIIYCIKHTPLIDFGQTKFACRSKNSQKRKKKWKIALNFGFFFSHEFANFSNILHWFGPYFSTNLTWKTHLKIPPLSK